MNLIKAIVIRPCWIDPNLASDIDPGNRQDVQDCRFKEATFFGLYLRDHTGQATHLNDQPDFADAFDEACVWAMVHNVHVEYVTDGGLIDVKQTHNPNTDEFENRDAQHVLQVLHFQRNRLLEILRGLLFVQPSEKLVRDRIPELFPQNTYRKASPGEHYAFLQHKLLEEAKEYLAAPEYLKEQELADVYEVLASLLLIEDLDPEDVARYQLSKFKKNGGLMAGHILVQRGDP